METKTISLVIPDSPHARQMLEYLRNQVATDEIQHWKGEEDDSEVRTAYAEYCTGMLQAWKDFAKALDEKL